MPKITADQLANYVADQQRRQTLSRELDGLKRKMAPLGEHFKAALTAANKRSMKRLGYTIELVDGAPLVSWKDELIAAAGAKAAAKILAQAPINQWVKVTPA